MHMNVGALLTLLFSSLLFVYTLFLLKYLGDTSMCNMDKQNRDFRKAAVVITWIQLVLSGLGALASLITLITGSRVTDMDLVGGALGSLASPSSESSLV